MAKVLLVEDDHTISTIYKIKLENSGYMCEQAFNGLEALNLVNRDMPDVILLDLKMPVMDGEQFLHTFRKKYPDSGVPVLVLTNLNRSEAPKTLWHLGISAYIVKAHITPSELITIIDKSIA